MKTISVRSPTRVDLAGGTLDLWPLYNFVSGPVCTVNVAINIFTYVEIQTRTDQKIEIHSEDLGFKKIYNTLNECLQDDDNRVLLFKEQLRFWQPQVGFKLSTRSESPVGGGLGGSSSLTISLLKAFSQLLNHTFASSHEMVQIAHNIEARILGTPTGTQDYYPAIQGGLNILTYDYRGIQQEILSIKNSILENNFLLVYTGKAHHSGINNFEVLTKAVQKDSATLSALQDVQQISFEMAKFCRVGQLTSLPDLFRREYKARIQLAKAFASPEIESLHQLTLQAGASAVKICGAGGGGCVLVWVTPEKRQGVINACEKSGFKVLAAKPEGL